MYLDIGRIPLALYDVDGVNVTTRCGGSYQVFHHAGEQRVLVAAYAVSEAYKSVCEWRDPRPVVPSTTGVRHEEAVTEYFARTSGLQGCRITRGVAITALHSEFTFTCPIRLAPAASSRT